MFKLMYSKLCKHLRNRKQATHEPQEEVKHHHYHHHHEPLPKKTLTDDEIESLLQSTNFTRIELEKHYQKFIHECPNGKMKQKQFIELYRKFFPTGKVDKYCKYVFKNQDSDSNGEVDFFEYIRAMSILIRGDIKEKLIMSFHIFDIDGNGTIEKKEMIELLESVYDIVGEKNRHGMNSPHKIVDKIMEELDTNKDGVLSIEEFLNGCKNDSCLNDLLAPTIYQVHF